MASLPDQRLMTPRTIKTLLEQAYAEGRAHENAAWNAPHGGGGPLYGESTTSIWADLFGSMSNRPWVLEEKKP